MILSFSFIGYRRRVRVGIAARRDVYLLYHAVDVGDDLAAGDDAVFVLLAALERGDLVLEGLDLLGHARELEVVELGGLEQSLERSLL